MWYTSTSISSKHTTTNHTYERVIRPTHIHAVIRLTILHIDLTQILTVCMLIIYFHADLALSRVELPFWKLKQYDVCCIVARGKARGAN